MIAMKSKQLKITGLRMEQGDSDYPADMPRYPKPGTKLAAIIECLEAEPATVPEIASYIGVKDGRTDAVKVQLNQLQTRGLVRKRGDAQWELVDPEMAAQVYAGID